MRITPIAERREEDRMARIKVQRSGSARTEEPTNEETLSTPQDPLTPEDYEALLVQLPDLSYRAIYKFNAHANHGLARLGGRYTPDPPAGWTVDEEDLYEAKAVLEKYFRVRIIEEECPGLGDPGAEEPSLWDAPQGDHP
jgi:hypothetical protein